MTRQEIVQALRCAFTQASTTGDCGECPYYRCEQLEGELKEKLGTDTWISCDFEKVSMDAANLIERLTAENAALREKVPQWISVEERRPEPGKRVLATDDVFVGEAYRTSADTWRRYDGIAMRDCLGGIVTHWMPLPSARKFADILRGAPETPEEGGKA